MDSTTTSADAIWTGALSRLQHEMTRATYERWFLPTAATTATSDTLTVQVRDDAALAWLNGRLKHQAERALRETGHPLAVSFILPPPPPSAELAPAPTTAESPPPATNGNGARTAKPAKKSRAKSEAREEGGGDKQEETLAQAGDTPRFAGFAPPIENWSKLPHQLIDALPFMGSEAEVKVILYILRHTWGFQDADKRITLDEFEQGRKGRDGTRIDKGVGMSRKSIIKGLRDAETHGFIKVEVNDNDLARIKKTYSLVMSQG
jgi:hypothetical protein